MDYDWSDDAYDNDGDRESYDYECSDDWQEAEDKED